MINNNLEEWCFQDIEVWGGRRRAQATRICKWIVYVWYFSNHIFKSIPLENAHKEKSEVNMHESSSKKHIFKSLTPGLRGNVGYQGVC